MSARDAIDALVMALDTPLLARDNAASRIEIGADYYEMRLRGLSSGECAMLRIAANLDDARAALPGIDDRLAALVVDALIALADETIR